MIIPIKCFRCGKILAGLNRLYVEEMEKIKNKNLPKEEKIDLITDMLKNKLKLKRYCCRTVMIAHRNMETYII